MFVKKLTAALAVTIVAALGLATVASAGQVHSRFYSIDVQADSPGALSLFLTGHPDGTLDLQRYRSGDLSQQWVLAQTMYPHVPDVTGSGPLTDFFEAFWDCVSNVGCPFSGHATNGSAWKVVNRLTGQCITSSYVNNAMQRARMANCAPSGQTMIDQVFGTEFDPASYGTGLPRSYTFLSQTHGQYSDCLGMELAQYTAGQHVRSGQCVTTVPWQHLRFLETADVTCTTGLTFCGVPIPPANQKPRTSGQRRPRKAISR
jgi:hypothetical protein